jgi:hypothetical protein
MTVWIVQDARYWDETDGDIVGVFYTEAEALACRDRFEDVIMSRHSDDLLTVTPWTVGHESPLP